MPDLVCIDCGKRQRLDFLDVVECRNCASANLRPPTEADLDDSPHSEASNEP